MVYRKGSFNNLIVNEFGGKLGEGIVNIINEKDIKMLGKDVIGIYVMNNKVGLLLIEYIVKNIGNIEIGDLVEKIVVGIYVKGVDVKFESGKIKIGKKVVGIYVEDF